MRRAKPPILLKDKYNKIIDNNQSADNFSNFFFSTYTQDDGSMPHISKLYQAIDNDIIFSCDEIRSQLHKLPNKNYCGPDGILNYKNYLRNYVGPYQYYFNYPLIKKRFLKNGK